MNEFNVEDVVVINNPDSPFNKLKGTITEVIFSENKGYLYRIVIEDTCMITLESERVLTYA